MKYVQLDEDGFVISAGESFLPDLTLPEGLTQYTEDFKPADAMKYRWVDGKPVFIGDAPTPDHKYDLAREEWVLDIELLANRQTVLIESEFHKRIENPITVDGIVIDADQTAQSNIKSKLEEIRARRELAMEMPASLLIWRDADNVVHTWPSAKGYEDWLKKAAIAMSERGTLLYKEVWELKDRLALADTEEKVFACVWGEIE